MYGERFHGEKPEKNKTQMAFSEKPPSKARELHLTKRDIGRLNDTRKFSENVRAQAETELTNAGHTVKDLSQQIEESNAKARARRKELRGLKKREKHEDESAFSVGETSKIQYMEVMRELEAVKQELSKLKLDIASVKEAKTQAEKLTEMSISRARSYSSSMEAIKKEIEEANEEEVLVELARMEAVKEYAAIESQREAEAARFSAKMEETLKRVKDLIQEINHSKELEVKLEATTSDADVLQNELKLVKAMERNAEKKKWDSLDSVDEISMRREEELLESTTAELNEAKKELASIREEGFQFMASMDIIRNELKHVTEETTHLKKLEEKTDSTVHHLNSRLLRAKSKLESMTVAEEKARLIVTNLSATLQQLQTEMEAGKKERELIDGETTKIKLEIQKTESNIELQEERLQAATQELEVVKASEAAALENLRALTEKTMRARASLSQHSSSITISNFENEYLTRRAEGAEEIADKKVAAAQAWIEALKAGEKEILMKTEMAHREIRELRVVEEQEMHKTEKALTAKRAVEGELHNWRQHEKQANDENLQPIEATFPRKSMKDNSIPATPRRAKVRRPASPGGRNTPRSSLITLRKKRTVMPNLVKFFRRKRNGKHP
ncbi:protein PLASTID MOVEMENT IMPAIRED 15 [Magnolia sinica]|uniref:protein PLASTID MOVEMENT IMPAIRED 15 n=1 Tax=Magnolia sinica TaxID=86752 RepID=UPI00265A930B|nr:protein PLASTID MOVEMENT IMPAIRED 15 [Magnolia sinica]XP_058091420.1 protein PLASTID MOVEMENT IMPAIRED 15 [Magnolia sinica]XP_058091421.1 protein PLASTID MOVEMENT IMPAIRED 15 [Magnolia sinica]